MPGDVHAGDARGFLVGADGIAVPPILGVAHDKMEQHGKVSGRQKQLLKTGIRDLYFEKTLISSPCKQDFDYSYHTQGMTTRTVSDWQIDLGNFCNSGCVFCNPEFSSRLAAEFKKTGLIEQVPPATWCDDLELLDRFIQDLKNSSNLKYLHFIGGETVLKLLDAGHSVLGIDRAIPPKHLLDCGAKWHTGDFASEIGLDCISNFKPDAIVHCAGTSLVGPSVTNPMLYYENNFVKTKIMLDYLIKQRSSRNFCRS